jgi:flagellar P-ring protein precursor FlgI
MLTLAAAGPGASTPVRVKDLVTIEGADPVELYGYGLVIGLNGTGDGRSISYTRQSIRNVLERMGLTVADDRIRAKNVASVMVTAMLTPWDRPGNLVDATVSSIGDAVSLAGGFLLLTELRGPDGALYATAQGALSVGGFDVSTFTGARLRRNYVTSGRVPEGARIVAGVEFELPENGMVHLSLDEPDFGSARRISEGLNEHWGLDDACRPVDAGRVAIDLTRLPEPREFALAMAVLDEVLVEPTVAAKIVINERTGTLVAGGDVRVQPATVSHGNLQVRIESRSLVSQPAPFSQTGQTVVVPETQLGYDTGNGSVVSLPAATSANELATALNALGVEPRDLIAIFQALKEAGALPAKMEIL